MDWRTSRRWRNHPILQQRGYSESGRSWGLLCFPELSGFWLQSEKRPGLPAGSSESRWENGEHQGRWKIQARWNRLLGVRAVPVPASTWRGLVLRGGRGIDPMTLGGLNYIHLPQPSLGTSPWCPAEGSVVPRAGLRCLISFSFHSTALLIFSNQSCLDTHNLSPA